MEYKLGWKRDKPDARDLYKVSVVGELPQKVDLRKYCPPVYDQGSLGSCTANAIGGCMQFERRKQKLKDYVPSRLFIYYLEREMEGTINEDAGAMLRDGIKAVVKYGACPEPIWPYDISRFAVKPSQKAYDEAEKGQVVRYTRLIPTVDQLRACLAQGYPFAFGFLVCSSFNIVGKTGIAPVPKDSDEVHGGHAVMAVGYDHEAEMFIVRNSWGEKWGRNGYFYLPYGFITDQLSSDFWAINAIEPDEAPVTKANLKGVLG